MDKEIVRHIANLSNISLSSSEEEKMTRELTKILEYISKIQEVSEDIEISYPKQGTPLRKDEVKASLPLSSLNKLSRYIEDNQFKVCKVIE